ncbi:MAG: hypothetical protein V4608_00655 [Bacteroidota bacterium]
MRKLNYIRTCILGLLLLGAVVANAQQEIIGVAFEFLQQNNLDSAKAAINRAVVLPETANDPLAWQVRGYVYKSIYFKTEKNNKRSPARIEALNSLKKSIVLDEAKEIYTENTTALKFLINSLHNDAAASLEAANKNLNPADYELAIELFKKSQEFYKIINPDPAVNQEKQIEFDLALGLVYNTFIESSKKDSTRTFKYRRLAKNLYNKVLVVDPDNVSANYSMGILYYNQAVELILASEYGDLEELERLQDNSDKLFKASLPFMEKAYTLDPTRPETLQGLTGIWFSLHETEKSNIYRQKLQDIEKPK